jgi:hypothetical protein
VLDPFILMVHSYQQQMCLVVDDLVQPVTDQALGSWLRGLPGLGVSRRSLADPLVTFTCGGGAARQPLADRVGRLVLFPDGWMTVGAEPVDSADPAAGIKARVALHCTDDGHGGRFRSVYPQGPAGDRVRWEYRRRFAPTAVDWLVERSAVPGSTAPAGLRAHLFGGGHLRGLSYFDRRDRASRFAVLGSSVLGSSYVAWTPNHAYQPGTPTEIDPAIGAVRAAARPWHSQDLGELPFNVEEVAVVAGYFAGGRFAVYDEGQDVSYWQTPLAFGLRLRKDLAAAAADRSAWGRVPSRVVLLTDFDAVHATARADVARGIGGTELITVDAPSTLSLDQGPGRGRPQARIALLPGDGGVAVPEWTSTTYAGISTRLSPNPAHRTGQIRSADAALRRPILHYVRWTGDQRQAVPRRPDRAGVPPRVNNGLFEAAVQSAHDAGAPTPGGPAQIVIDPGGRDHATHDGQRPERQARRAGPVHADSARGGAQTHRGPGTGCTVSAPSVRLIVGGRAVCWRRAGGRGGRFRPGSGR